MPRLETQQLILNPVKSNYFYLIKYQGIDNDMEIKNFVLEEDYDKLQSSINIAKDEIPEVDEDSNDDSDASIHEEKRDYFEIAMQKLREAKDYNIGKFDVISYLSNILNFKQSIKPIKFHSDT